MSSSAAPWRLVEQGMRRFGRFAVPPVAANPLDERASARLLRRLRLKEWVGFGLTHPDWYAAFIIQDAKYLVSSAVYVYDRRRGKMYEYSAARPGTFFLDLPDHLLEGRCRWSTRGYALTFDFSESRGAHRVTFDLAGSRSTPAIAGTLSLDATRASAPLVVSARLATGDPIYTHKAIFPVEGALRIGADDVRFDPARDLAILDEHKSFFPYRTAWRWGTFAFHMPEGLVGANFADHRMAPGEPEESCVWTSGACEPLDGVRFEASETDEAAPWRVTSSDGRLDVTFRPEARKKERQRFGVVDLDYFQSCGRFTGTLRGGGRQYAIDEVYGVCERMRARF
ncbi:MAG: DUF2804 domain-containing protein [Polyangiales bacterium]